MNIFWLTYGLFAIGVFVYLFILVGQFVKDKKGIDFD